MVGPHGYNVCCCLVPDARVRTTQPGGQHLQSTHNGRLEVLRMIRSRLPNYPARNKTSGMLLKDRRSRRELQTRLLWLRIIIRRPADISQGMIILSH